MQKLRIPGCQNWWKRWFENNRSRTYIAQFGKDVASVYSTFVNLNNKAALQGRDFSECQWAWIDKTSEMELTVCCHSPLAIRARVIAQDWLRVHYHWVHFFRKEKEFLSQDIEQLEQRVKQLNREIKQKTNLETRLAGEYKQAMEKQESDVSELDRMLASYSHLPTAAISFPEVPAREGADKDIEEIEENKIAERGDSSTNPEAMLTLSGENEEVQFPDQWHQWYLENCTALPVADIENSTVANDALVFKPKLFAQLNAIQPDPVPFIPTQLNPDQAQAQTLAKEEPETDTSSVGNSFGILNLLNFKSKPKNPDWLIKKLASSNN